MTEFEKFKSDVIKRCAIEHDELKYNLELKFMADKWILKEKKDRDLKRMEKFNFWVNIIMLPLILLFGIIAYILRAL